jgi:hypothetical protein
MQVGRTDKFGLNIQDQMTWTSSETDNNSQANTNTANATLVCPSTAYTGPTLFTLYWDIHYGTFLFVPYDPTSMEIIQHGVVTDAHNNPVAAEPVNLEYAGHIYHTLTTPSGAYRFVAVKGLNPGLENGTIDVRGARVGVRVRSQEPSAIRLQ